MARKTTNTQPTIRAAIYTRVSTEDQANEGYGLDVQLERCRALAVVKGWQVVAEYSDAGISGTKDTTARAGLAAIFDAANAGEIDAVIILALDRLGRKTALVLDLVEQLTAAGIILVSCKESLDTSTPQGQFVLTMFAALAQLERDLIVERTTAGRNARGMVDGERGGRMPMGYIRLEGGVIEIDETSAGLVRHIFSLRDSGLTLRAIAESLNKQGYTTSRGKSWHASSIREILLNEADYRGGQRWQSASRWPVILAA